MQGCCWVPLLGPIAQCHFSVPLLGCHCRSAIAGCHRTGVLLGAIAGCHCWVHCWGAIGGVPLLGAIAGCSTNFPTLGAIARCHCWMPLGESNCWVPLREKIGQSDTPFSSASFSTLITQIGLCYLGSMLVYIILWTSSAIIYGKCSPPDLNHPRVSRASVETDTKNSGKPAPSQKKTWKLQGCLLSLPHCFQEHHEEKSQEEEDKNAEKKKNNTCKDTQCI